MYYLAEMADEILINEKQERFCQEYLIDLHITNAAKRAGYSEATAYSIGSELLKKPEIAARIKQLKEDVFASVGITQARVYRELSRLAFVDLAGIFDESGALKPMHLIDDDTRAAIAGVEIDELFEGIGRERQQAGVTKKIKLSDKLNALAQIIKIGGWNAPTKTELTGANGTPLEVPVIKIYNTGPNLSSSET